MKTYDFVHLVLYAAGGRIEGRTKLQKFVYFAGVLTEMHEDLGYRAHYYGPYSPKVTAAVEELRGLGFLEQRKAGGGHVDPRGFEFARYDYALTPDGMRIAEEKSRLRHKVWETIQHAVERLDNADPSDYLKLSIAAKAYYLVHRAKEPITDDQLLQLCQSFGWQVSPEQIAEAIQWLKSLSLVRG
ncbi:MAG: hypothetical protein L0211_08110 [Planctomycetaceae bacterium]|nr:hypothetical protein [Planctomycetaceae bacterium]